MAEVDMFDADALGAELVSLRNDVHLSQRRLASLSGVSNTQISDLEMGTAPAPHPVMLQKLARGLATRGSGDVDEVRATEAYRLLMGAAGYLPAARAQSSDEDGRTDAELDARIIEIRSDPKTYVALMHGVQDPTLLSRAAKIAIIETVESIDAGQPKRRQG